LGAPQATPSVHSKPSLMQTILLSLSGSSQGRQCSSPEQSSCKVLDVSVDDSLHQENVEDDSWDSKGLASRSPSKSHDHQQGKMAQHSTATPLPSSNPGPRLTPRLSHPLASSVMAAEKGPNLVNRILGDLFSKLKKASAGKSGNPCGLSHC
jgi:hypothetical protein